MNETDYSPSSGRIWPIVAAVVIGFGIAGAGLVCQEWLMPALVTGGAIMALGAMGGLTVLRLAQHAYQRVLAEQADNRQKYESLVGNLPGAVYRGDWNADWTMNFMSDGIHGIVGHPSRSFLPGGGVTYGSLIHADDAKLVEDAVAAAANRDEPFTIEYRVRHKDGSERWVFEKGRVIKSADGKPTFLDGVIFDITDRKQAILAMQRIQEELRTLLDAALAG